MYRSQLLLQQLGISQWIAKSEDTIVKSTDLLWRDQEIVEIPPAAQNPQSNHDHHLSVPTQLTNLAKQSVTISSKVVGTEISLEPIIKNHVDQEDVEDLAGLNFHCHLLIHEEFIILAEVESAEEQQLFQQIAKACQAKLNYIQWPLGVDGWLMHRRALQAYLHGVFAAHQNKKMLCLGDVGFNVDELTVELIPNAASLKQLLTSHADKKALWQILSSLIYP